MPKDLAIVLNNGSINSAVVTAMAAQKYRPIMLFVDISAQPGGRTRASFDQQVAHFKPYREYTIALPFATSGKNQPAISIADPRQTTPMGPQMLEMLPLVSIAVKYAVYHQAAAIYLGARVGSNTDELSQATEYFQIWNEMIQIPCGQTELEVATPLLELEPWQVVDVGFQVAVPFDRTWSCQEESSDPCWACRGCKAREAAFQQAGKPDPLRAARKV
jgi:7-cyano-7-deazaguanine synthase in queuosine biosynthesis